MARATILGAAGFVGSRLRRRLEGQGIDPFCPAKGDPAVFEEELGVVYDCAGLTADYAARPFDTVEAHATLVARLAEKARFDRLIVLSSTRLYDSSAAEVAREDDPLTLNPAEPRHIYDLSKALGENIALTQTSGRGAVARLSNVFDWQAGAPGFLSEWLIRAAGADRAFTLDSSPGVARDYIHVDDVVDALLAIAAAPAPGIVNVASGELVENRQIAEVFAAAGWRVDFARDAAPPAPPCASVAKLRDLGVSPRPALDVVRGYLESLA
ncbi:MAG: NAD(P)-dependent oxidoreductase [Phenylobacterium sp.]|nr:NAD(P)-dependent oxidoreductase [Phenylobacterium sp.]